MFYEDKSEVKYLSGHKTESLLKTMLHVTKLYFLKQFLAYEYIYTYIYLNGKLCVSFQKHIITCQMKLINSVNLFKGIYFSLITRAGGQRNEVYMFVNVCVSFIENQIS